MREDLHVGDAVVKPGSRLVVRIPVSVMSDHTPMDMSVVALHGREPGPTVFLSAAIHGDEIIGVEIVRRVLRVLKPRRMQGTLLAVPIVNSFGFINRSRYLPDRRDLNRCFPGSEGGSLAGRLADIFLQEVVSKCDYGVDLHSAAIHRTNLPQIRIAGGNDKLIELAAAFAAPLTLTSPLRDGSLREAARAIGVEILLFEAGEALRFDETAIRVGVSGTLRVLAHLGMISGKGLAPPRIKRQIRSRGSSWMRAEAGGLLRTYKTTGDLVEKGTVLGIIADPIGNIELPVRAREAGLIIGRTNLPLVNEGDGIFHVARVESTDDAETALDRINAHVDGDPLFDEDEII